VKPAARDGAISYRSRLLLGYILVVTLLSAIWAWSLYGPVTAAVTEQQSQRLLGIARASAVAFGQPVEDVQVLAHTLTGDGYLRVTVIAGDGRVLADSQEDPAAMANHGRRPEVASALAGRTGRDIRRSETQGTDQLYVAVPATISGRAAAVRVSERLVTIGAIAANARGVGLGLLAVAVVLAAAAAWWLAADAAAPVSRLVSSARAMAAGDLSVPVDDAPGELGNLSHALRELAEQTKSRIITLGAEQGDLRAVLDGLHDAVFLLEDGVVRLANEAASTLFKVPHGGWQGHVLDETVLPASLASVVRDLASTRENVTEEVGPDPTLRWLRVTVVPLDIGARPSRTLIIIADVTERMRLDKIRTDFVASASHELKTPTAAIQLLADSAAIAAQDGNTARALDFVGQLRAETDRLRRLVNDLLDLSRLESAPEVGTITNLREAIALSVTAHGSAAAAKGISLLTDLSGVQGQDVYARADPTDIAVALDNLLDNAITYTESGSVTVSVTSRPDSVTVLVADTGIGIPPQDLPRVFERFYRVDRSRTRASGGTGLGLSLVKHVVERSGGRVFIESTPDVGTEVDVTFPRA